MKKSHYTYLLYNGEQFYIGVRSCNGRPEDDHNYLSSSHDKDFKNSIVAKTILRTFKTRKEANLHEIQLHQFHDVGVNPKFANRAKATATGFCRQGKPHTAETRAKIAAAGKGISRNKGQKLSVEHKAKLLVANKGKKHTEKTKYKISAANKGNSYRKGKKHSVAALARMSAIKKGKKNSKETRARMSTAKTGLNHPAADHTVYIFSHETGEIFTGTRFEFKEKYKICVGALFKKKYQRYTVKGWRATCKLL